MSSAELDESDYQAVMGVLRSGRLALGGQALEFERQMAAYVGVRHAISVSSGTAALHLLVRALGIGAGDEVIVPSFTFAASANAILYERATPVFCEIEPQTYNLDPDDVRRRITPRTKAIMAVDVFGHPADWDALQDIAERYGLALIDDCCEALGAEYRGRKVGSFGAAGAFAFYPNKQMTTGEGGMIVTDDARIAALCRALRNQGRGQMSAWLEHEHLGYNYRLDEMSAALGVTQLARIETFLAKRAAVAQMYTERLAGLDMLRTPLVQPHAQMSWFVYVVTLAEGLDRDVVIARMEQEGIPARGYFFPTHLQPYIRQMLGYRGGELPLTEGIARRTLALPFHNNLMAAQVEQVAACLARAAQ
ncbi:MAG: DegT/DnrJ/EryC1/StrS family aminotransferase [Chloroflexi bacterium]|nr:DegT/DnrJ/EryC1/StrS family aminotransferase [Chloroflexota bacterium]